VFRSQKTADAAAPALYPASTHAASVRVSVSRLTGSSMVRTGPSTRSRRSRAAPGFPASSLPTGSTSSPVPPGEFAQGEFGGHRRVAQACDVGAQVGGGAGGVRLGGGSHQHPPLAAVCAT
jgi:hypothetical protein